MNRKMLALAAGLLAPLLLTTAGDLPAFIQFEAAQPSNSVTRVSLEVTGASQMAELLNQLETITGLQLEVQNTYLRVREPERLPLLYAASRVRDVYRSTTPDHRWSPTAQQLLLSAMRSSSVYRVREDSRAALGRVDLDQTIELDFDDFSRIVYRDLPKQTFDAGMIFLHELAHRHLRLTDPTRDQIKRNSMVKGDTVEFLNRIERELALPERRHYAPVKLRFVRDEPRWGIYFGKETDRVEFDSKFVLN